MFNENVCDAYKVIGIMSPWKLYISLENYPLPLLNFLCWVQFSLMSILQSWLSFIVLVKSIFPILLFTCFLHLSVVGVSFIKGILLKFFCLIKTFYPSQTNWFMLLTKGCFWFYMCHFMFSVVCLSMCLLIVSFCFFQNTHCYFYFLFILKVYIFCFIFYEVFYF